MTYEERRKLKKRLRWIVSRAENAIDAGLAACEQGTDQLDAMVSISIEAALHLHEHTTIVRILHHPSSIPYSLPIIHNAASTI